MAKRNNIVAAGVQRYLVVHEYGGQAYFGWQRQPEELTTVQSVLEKAISEFLGTETFIYGSSRTDKGKAKSGDAPPRG